MQNVFLISSLLVLAVSLQSEAISWPHSHDDHVVHDSEGNELQADQAYYLVSAARAGRGGGVALDRRQRSGHSSMVMQHSSDTNFGSPVSFSLATNSHDDITAISRDSFFESAVETMFFENTPSPSQGSTIREGTDMNIRFSEMPVVWHVQDSQQSSSSKSQMRYVTIGGRPGHPGSSTVRNWFKIQRISRSSPEYKIAYCPSVCDSCQVECGSIGIMEESGKRMLTVSQHREFPFVFVRARRS